ncbi:MAG: bioH [Firmicutes bacterium]|nr:bioH [Bacillota bacterium]
MCAGRSGESPLPYEEAGSGPPVLLVHGLLSAPSLWNGVAALLAERFRVIRCDLRRHSGPRPGHGLAESRTNGLLTLIERLDLPPVHLVAHGSGCPTVTALASRTRERVRTVAVVDPVVPRSDSAPAIQAAWHLENLLQWLAVAYGSAVRAPQHVAAIAAVVAQQTHASLCEPAPGVFPPGDFAGGDMGGLHGISCPVLALTGEHSSTESKAMVAKLFGGLPALRWAEVPGSGRHSPREAPAATALLLQQFLTANG